jgi:hypothetical protein
MEKAKDEASQRVELHLRIDNDFVYHAPSKADIEIHQELRSRALDFARYLVDYVPMGREQSLALTKLEEMVFWANAGIARKEEE